MDYPLLTGDKEFKKLRDKVKVEWGGGSIPELFLLNKGKTTLEKLMKVGTDEYLKILKEDGLL